MDDATAFKNLESLTDYAIRMVGSGIEVFGVLIIVTGIAWSTYLHLRRPMPREDTEVYKIRIGRARVGAHLSQLDAGSGNRRTVAMAARAIAYVIESSAGRNCRCALTNTGTDAGWLQQRDGSDGRNPCRRPCHREHQIAKHGGRMPELEPAHRTPRGIKSIDVCRPHF